MEADPSGERPVRRRVLIVDDEPSVRVIARLFLLRVGFEVFEAECGVKALALIREKGIEELDLLLTDINMPNMDGVSLAERCKRYYPLLRIVFMSGGTGFSVPENSPLERWHFIPKPFRLEAFVSTVLNALK